MERFILRIFDYDTVQQVRIKLGRGSFRVLILFDKGCCWKLYSLIRSSWICAPLYIHYVHAQICIRVCVHVLHLRFPNIQVLVIYKKLNEKSSTHTQSSFLESCYYHLPEACIHLQQPIQHFPPTRSHSPSSSKWRIPCLIRR